MFKEELQPNRSEYDFTADWFTRNVPIWEEVVIPLSPRKILEIGSFEGRSACYVIEKCSQSGPITLYCVDTWKGGLEHDRNVMVTVEQRFDHNIMIALKSAKHACNFHKLKGPSSDKLANLIDCGHASTFDLIYVDGSHRAPDVLTDAVMSFYLLRIGGLLIFDDYLWHMERPGQQDLLNMPKLAIDAFLNIFVRCIRVLPGLPMNQIYAWKTMS